MGDPVHRPQAQERGVNSVDFMSLNQGPVNLPYLTWQSGLAASCAPGRHSEFGKPQNGGEIRSGAEPLTSFHLNGPQILLTAGDAAVRVPQRDRPCPQFQVAALRPWGEIEST